MTYSSGAWRCGNFSQNLCVPSSCLFAAKGTFCRLLKKELTALSIKQISAFLPVPTEPSLPLQVVEDGYEFFAKRQLVTLFSAPNYCGEFDNAGAMMSVDETLMCSFQVKYL